MGIHGSSCSYSVCTTGSGGLASVVLLSLLLFQIELFLKVDFLLGAKFCAAAAGEVEAGGLREPTGLRPACAT
jgi:hypothetical protein